MLDPKIKLKIGLTTNTFSHVLRNGETSLNEIIGWAAEQGFSWVEVRDSRVEMDAGTLEGLRKAGGINGVRLHYAWDTTDVLEPDDGLFNKGIGNAKLFGAGTHCRITIAFSHLGYINGNFGYSKEQYEKIIPAVERYVLLAKKEGIEISFENAAEPVKGDNKTYFGMSELLEKCPVMNTTFDPGNFANRHETRPCAGEKELLEYAGKYRKQIPYCHVKMTKNNAVMPSLVKGDFDIRQLLAELSLNADTLICLELPAGESLSKIKKNIADSIEFINKQLT